MSMLKQLLQFIIRHHLTEVVQEWWSPFSITGECYLICLEVLSNFCKAETFKIVLILNKPKQESKRTKGQNHIHEIEENIRN